MTAMNAQPIDVYETRAAEQRRQLHGSVEDLKGVLRQRLDLKANAREYMLPAAGILGLIGLAVGYGFAGIFYAGRPRYRPSDWVTLE